MATSEFIQQAYIAFFNRPADADGFYFWLTHTGPDQDLLDLFAQSEEYQSDYGGLTNRQIISKVYQNLFGREPETEGWDYWEAQMDAGWVTISNAAYEILGGAQGTDLTTINNKTTAAQAFTDALDTPDEIDAYARAGDNNVGYLAKEWLAMVSYAPESLVSALAPDKLDGVLTTLLDANTDFEPEPEYNTHIINGSPTDNETLTLSTDKNVHDTLKWNGNFGNVNFYNGNLTVVNFDTTSATGQDRLDFTEYGAKLLYIIDTLGDPSMESNGSFVPGFRSWRLPDEGKLLDIGDTYIILQHLWTSSTIYKIELWTSVNGGGPFGDGGPLCDYGVPEQHQHTSQLIGYVDIGCVIDSSVLDNIDF
ncbi:MAG: DUF4214 domain-containing protein [Betaproteobacteria bacterium]|nr:DUF4214 domain-containing protein [Betaproteobacteria bacterium]